MKNGKVYNFGYEDANLLRNLEIVTNRIMDVYHTLMEKEIAKDSRVDKEIEKLKKLKEEEKVLYREIEQRKDCVNDFYSIICKKYNMELSDTNNYFHLEKFCFNDQNACFRMKNILHDKLLKDTYKKATEEIANKYFGKNSGMFQNVVNDVDDANYAFDLFVSTDIYNTYLHRINREIHNTINNTIQNDLIKAKYNIISAYPILEDTYIKKNFTIEDPVYLVHGIILDFYHLPTFVKDTFFQTLFPSIVENKMLEAMLLGEKPYSSDNYKTILMDVLFVDSILNVGGKDKFQDTTTSILNKPYKENNIAKFLLTDIIQNKNMDNSVLKLSLSNRSSSF